MRQVIKLGSRVTIFRGTGKLGGRGNPIQFSVGTTGLLPRNKHYHVAREFSLVLYKTEFAVSVFVYTKYPVEGCTCSECRFRHRLLVGYEGKRRERFQPYEFSGCSRDKEEA